MGFQVARGRSGGKGFVEEFEEGFGLDLEKGSGLGEAVEHEDAEFQGFWRHCGSSSSGGSGFVVDGGMMVERLFCL